VSRKVEMFDSIVSYYGLFGCVCKELVVRFSIESFLTFKQHKDTLTSGKRILQQKKN